MDEWGIQKFEYFDNEKNIVGETKSIFHNFLRVIIWKEKKDGGHKLFPYCSRLTLKHHCVVMLLGFFCGYV